MHNAVTWWGRCLGTWALYGYYVPAHVTCDVCHLKPLTLMRVPFLIMNLHGSTRYHSAENPVWRSK